MTPTPTYTWISCVVIAGLLSVGQLDAGLAESFCTSTVLNTTASYVTITASSSYDADNGAEEAILNVGAGWVAFTGSTVQWLKVDLGQVWRIRKLFVKAVHAQYRYWYSRDVRISHSMDGNVWVGYNSHLSFHPLGETVTLNTNRDIVTNITLTPEITARFIALAPDAYRGRPTLSVEMAGCIVPDAEAADGTSIVQDIQSDVVWRATMSPIVIDRPISVLPAGSLHIEAGVTIVFTADTGIKVLGSLEAHGRDGLPVLFTSDSPALAARGQWLGLEQTQGGAVNMSYVVIRQAVYGLQGTSRLLNMTRSSVYSCEAGLQIHEGRTEAASSVLSSSEISYNVFGIQLHGRKDSPHIHITDSVITHNARHGILVNKWINSLVSSTLDTELLLQHCNITDNTQSGIVIRATWPLKIAIEKSSLTYNSNHGVYMYRRKITRTELNINSSKVNYNGKHGSYIQCYSCADFNVSVTLSEFLTNSQSGLYLLNTNNANSLLNVSIENNTFSQESNAFALKMSLTYSRLLNIADNTFRDSSGGVSLTGRTSHLDDAKANITENLFDNIYGQRQSAIHVKGISTNLTYNTLHNITSGSGIHIESGLDHEVKENAFNNVEQLSCLLRVDSEFMLTRVLLAPDNYWGFHTIDVIKSKICDFFLDAHTARVKLERYYSSSTKTVESLTAIQGEDELRNTPDGLGGVIVAGQWNAGSNVNLLINRSIIVGEEANVTIGGASKLRVAENRGIVVLGNVHFGDRTQGLSVLNASTATWQGFFIWNGGLALENCNISDTEIAFTVPSSIRAVSISLDGVSVETGTLTDAGYINGYFEISMYNVNVESTYGMTVAANSSHPLAINVTNSVLSTRYGNGIAVQTSRQLQKTTTVLVTIKNSTLQASNYAFQASSCNINLKLNVTNATFTNTQALHISVLSFDSLVKNSSFLGGSRAVYVALCRTSNNYSPLNSRQLELKDNAFLSTYTGEYIYVSKSYYDSHSHNIRIVNNTFTSMDQKYRTRNGIRINLDRNNEEQDFLIENNTFSGFRGLCIQHYGAAKRFMIRGNVFRNNSRVIYSQLWTSTLSPFIITNNTFINNTASQDSPVIQLEYGSASHSYILHGNDLTNNTGHSVVGTSTTNLTVTNNFFDNPDVGYNIELYHNSYPQESDVVNASYNFWGTTNVNFIASKLYDSSFSSDLADIVFRPYLGSRNISDVQDEERSFVSSSGEIGGAVQGTVTLTASDGPYTVVSNIEITDSDTLVIKPGTELLFRENIGITAFGEFRVEGNMSHPVLMKPERLDSKWRGLELRIQQIAEKRKVRAANGPSLLEHLVVMDTTVGVVVNGQSANLNNVTSHNSYGHGFTFNLNGDVSTDNATYTALGISSSNSTLSGVQVSLLAEETDVEMRISLVNCKLLNNSEHGILVSGNASILLHKCRIENNTKSGIFLDQQHNSKMLVQQSYMSMNKEHLISSSNSRNIELVKSSIEHHDSRYRYYSSIRTRPLLQLIKQRNMPWNINISDNSFFNNTGDGMKLVLNYYSAGEMNLTIHSNNFTNNVGLLELTDNARSYFANSVNISIQNNTFTNNSDDGERGLLSFDAWVIQSMTVRQNSFRNNRGKILLQLTGTKRSDSSPGRIAVLSNTMLENQVNTTIAIDVYHETNIRDNILVNSEATCELLPPAFKRNHFIDARENFWGSADLAVVSSKVCGFDVNMLQSFVYYSPFRESADSNATVDGAHDVFSLMGVYGGVIDGTFTLPTRSEPYTIRRSIYIRNGASLIVDSGTSLKFAKGRGIYVEGALVVKGSLDTPVKFTGVGDGPWHGIFINSSASVSSDLAYLHMNSSEQGISILSASVNIANSVISNVKYGITIRLGDVDAMFDFSGTVIQNATEHGIAVVDSTGNMTFVNVTVLNCGQQGILFQSESGHLNLHSSTVANCSRGLDVTFTSVNVAGNVTIDDCTFFNNSKYGVKLLVYNSRSENQITLTDNKFINNSVLALDVTFYRYYSSYSSSRTIEIGSNEFTNNGRVYVGTWNYMNVSFHDNIVNGNTDRQVEDCAVVIEMIQKRNLPENTIDIQSNLFEGITGYCAVEVTSNERYAFEGTFKYNRLLSNAVVTGVIFLNSLNFNLTENIFDNPASPFDLYVTLKKAEGDANITAAQNWWGRADPNFVRTRIYDSWRDSDLVTVVFQPFLTDPDFDCSGVEDCNSRGECVRPNGCRCDSGWTGLTCSEYDCAGVDDCFGHGECIAPNVCNCSEGWTGNGCSSALCTGVSECTGHGLCVQPDVCLCAEKFTGRDCSACVSLHWGPTCIPCPDCQHGMCDVETGMCICDGSSWTGNLCDECSETYYRPNCLPLMMLLNVFPNSGSDRGGNTVHFRGHNFPETSPPVYLCKFGSEVVEGSWVDRRHVTCVAPAQAEGTVVVEISPNGTSYTDNKLTYTYYATCPPGSCGRDVDPPRGQCLFGGCSCNLPWSGENCSREILSPVIQTPDEFQTTQEGTSYSFEPVLLQGSPPVSWSLVTGPEGMIIDEGSGRVQWSNTLAASFPHGIQLQAKNIVGQDVVTWELLVPASYTANVTSVEPSGILDVPVPIRISGYLTFKPGYTARVSAVDVRVQGNNNRLVDVSTISDPLQPDFYVTNYFPRPDDTGIFEVTARHPASTEPEGSRGWSVRGMACTPSYVTWQAFLDTDTVIFRAASTLFNVGVDPVTNVTATIEGLGGPLIDVYIRPSNNESSRGLFLPELKAGESLAFDIVANASGPLRGQIQVVFSSPGGTTTRLRVSLHFNVRSPVLVFSPSSLKVSAVIGRQTLVSAVLRNEGEVTATSVMYDIPNDPKDRLSLVSFAVVNSSSEENGQATALSIQPGGEAILTLAVTLQADEEIGQMSGSIAVNAQPASGALLPYTIYLTSVARLNLTITVEDEYTYFAAGAPLVSGATVRLVNHRQPYSEVRYTTNETGTVTFENILEDQYTLTASADRHGGLSQVILIDRDEPDIKIFLQRIAVQYTWTVTPTTVEDKYVITLDSTFETQVPMPVVTIEPAKVNTIPYELGEKSIIPFRVTNHGLIRADNLRYRLPDHPYLRFESLTGDIGSIEANTTLELPVQVVLKQRPARNAVANSVCGLALLYDYVCGGTQTRGLDVTLTREVPGSRPLPCGTGGGSGGSGPGGGGGGVSGVGGGTRVGSGSSYTYNPETPLSCDCAKTLIKSCALAYHPIAGCAIAVTDLGTSLTPGRTGGSAVVGGLNVVVGLADTAFSCVFGVICQLCGLFYTTLRCIVDISSNCGDNRRRRDVSSETVSGMRASSEPMENFLQMMSVVFGDTNMYDIDHVWYSAFKPAVSDDSDDGILLSQSEFNSVLAVLSEDEQKTVLSKFLIRWNTTAVAWQDGTLAELTDTTSVISLERLTPRVQQYLLDLEGAKERGFDSIFDEFDYVSDVYTTAERNDQEQDGGGEEGVCAKVRVRIVQELVLTRDAFNARLEIENGETTALEDIRVEIWIKQTFGSGELMNDLFGIGSPVLIGLSAVDGTGRLGRDLSGSAEWLIIPSSEAAPVEDTLYDVGGRLSYRAGGSNFSVPLLPDTITVKPNPSLVVHYFHEKYVQGDNALTTEVVEPIVPFTLAVMVMNAGYGVARALKITSAQPEIIENEKGLLVSFQIIGALIGNEPMTSSLTVDFGDIASFETKTARWLLTSTLMGTFSNFSATFENINPLGDPQLSLLDELGYHELIHLVRIDTSPDADDLDDFLVNDRLGANSLPDKLYNSENGSDVQTVKIANITKFEISRLHNIQDKVYKYVNLELVASDCQWFYCRIENVLTRFEPDYNEHLLSVTRDDGREVLVDKNAWQTNHILDKHFFHLLDYDVDGINRTFTHMYILMFGPLNQHRPMFNATAYQTTIVTDAEMNSRVLQIEAYDLDGDEIQFSMSHISYFEINDVSGEIFVARRLDKVDTFGLNVTVTDSGLPPKSSTTIVTITVKAGPTFTTVSTVSTSSQSTTLSSTTSTVTNVTTSPTASTSLQTTVTSPTSDSSTTTTAGNVSSTSPSTTAPTSTGSSTTGSTASSTATPSATPSSSITPSTTAPTVGEPEGQLESWVKPTAVVIGAVVLVAIVATAVILCRRMRQGSSMDTSTHF